MSIFGFSGLPSSPTSQQTSFGSIQPWAQPYIADYLTRAQQLTQGTPQPSALQQQAYTGAANLALPDAFAQGAALANAGGQGNLSTAPMALEYGKQGAQYGAQGTQYGGLGSAIGLQAAQAGGNYAQQATDPGAMAAYMNPYIQQSLAPQMALLNQQQQLGAQNIAAKAVGQGAFGGNRATLAQGLNAQNYDLARQQAIGQGYNTAFQQAQQAQQFGANLGLQGLGTALQGQQVGLAGLGTAMQGAGVGLQGVGGAQQGYSGATQAGAALGNIGAQQAAAQLGILGMQNQLGTQQYNLPFQNLQFQQGMLSGLPISSTTQQGYQAPPNTASQIGNLGLGALGAYAMYKGLAKGGKVGSDLADIQLHKLVG